MRDPRHGERPSDMSTAALRAELAEALAGHNPAGAPLVLVGGPPNRTAVFFCGNLVAKCYLLPSAKRKSVRERRAYDFLAGSGLPVPTLVASGRLASDTPWLLTTRLAGEGGDNVRQRLSALDRIDLYRQAGTLLAKLHLLPVDERLTGEPVPDNVSKYAGRLAQRVERYRQEAESYHTRLASRACAQGWLTSLGRKAQPLLTFAHGDFSDRNFILGRSGTGWKLAGLIDFELCEHGDGAIDFARMLVATEDWTGAAFSSF